MRWTLCGQRREADAEKELNRDERFAKAYALDKERLELEQKKLAIEEQKYTNEQKRLEQEKERLDNEANNLYLKRIAEEQRIMSMDLSAMSDMQRQYYMCLQAEIVARRMN
jgi:ABC-type phosphate transport system auxiliary subunit